MRQQQEIREIAIAIREAVAHEGSRSKVEASERLYQQGRADALATLEHVLQMRFGALGVSDD